MGGVEHGLPGHRDVPLWKRHIIAAPGVRREAEAF
jgi:hypothetical protein